MIDPLPGDQLDAKQPAAQYGAATPSQVAMGRRSWPRTPPQGKAERGDQPGAQNCWIGIVPIHPPTLRLYPGSRGICQMRAMTETLRIRRATVDDMGRITDDLIDDARRGCPARTPTSSARPGPT